MKITLFMATSINGYVTGQADDTEWVKDTEILYKIIAEKGACVMGKRTYLEADKYNAFPYKSAINIVLTHDQELINKSTKEMIFTKCNPSEVIKILEDRGISEVVIVGGGHVNTQFLNAGLINEIIIDVHPIIIDEGIKLFEGKNIRSQLDLISSEKLADGMVQNIYRVTKS